MASRPPLKAAPTAVCSLAPLTCVRHVQASPFSSALHICLHCVYMLCSLSMLWWQAIRK